jgi:hypothetical protein
LSPRQFMSWRCNACAAARWKHQPWPENSGMILVGDPRMYDIPFKETGEYRIQGCIFIPNPASEREPPKGTDLVQWARRSILFSNSVAVEVVSE